MLQSTRVGESEVGPNGWTKTGRGARSMSRGRAGQRTGGKFHGGGFRRALVGLGLSVRTRVRFHTRVGLLRPPPGKAGKDACAKGMGGAKDKSLAVYDVSKTFSMLQENSGLTACLPNTTERGLGALLCRKLDERVATSRRAHGPRGQRERRRMRKEYRRSRLAVFWTWSEWRMPGVQKAALSGPKK